MSSHLHLRILAPQVNQAAVGKHLPHIPGAIDAFISACVANELCLCEIRLIPIARGKKRTSDGNFSKSVGNNRTILVEQKNVLVFKGIPGRYEAAFKVTVFVDDIGRDVMCFSNPQ